MKQPRKVSLSFAILLLVGCQVQAQNVPPPRQQGFAVFNSPGLRVDAGKYWYFPFQINAYLRRARLAGNIQAQGGSGNDIIVRVAKDGQVIYDSGQQRSIVLSVDVSEPGAYVLIVSNEFSVFSGKVVWGSVNVFYDGVDEQRDTSERQIAAQRFRLAQSVLDRLFVALKADEREWATFQIQYKPRLIIKTDNSLNAQATPESNTIWINRGTFEVTEAYGAAEKESMLAGVIGHELAHIFYKHRNEHPSGWSVWDEITGALPLDRLQEQQADALGVQLACQAGFDSRGLSWFLQRVMDRYGNQGSFRTDHPQTSQRVQAIQALARNCKR
jgi:hypothetical protein